ncbi:acid protease [Daedalea quercina L-15889]|uniref:Acid protease n=1 Tax=Daedalea quercina L-15889 TaxID=1314783 RepID=A0A165NWL2_9APHY|nr:acid protease [Daedalea quercina L-15889]
MISRGGRTFSGAKAAVVLAFLGAVQISANQLVKIPIKSTLRSDVTGLNPSAPMTNALVKVVTAVQAGNNQTFPNVWVDTGSALLWVGAQEKYIPGPYTQAINQTFSLNYGSGGVNGTAYEDRVTIGSATVDGQIIGSESYFEGFTGVWPIDGLLGLGPTGSNQYEVSGYNTTPTFIDNLYSQGKISEPVFGLYIPPYVPGEESTGELTFGGVDSSKFTGDIEWIPQTTPTNEHWNFMVRMYCPTNFPEKLITTIPTKLSSLAWGNITVPSPIYGRTDCGVLQILIPTETLLDMYHTLPGSSPDSTDSMLNSCLIFPSNVTVDELPAVEFGLGNLTVSILSTDYVVPESQYAALNVTDDGQIHTWLCPGGPSAVNLGQKALEHIYSAYDTVNNLVGFAPAVVA